MVSLFPLIYKICTFVLMCIAITQEYLARHLLQPQFTRLTEKVVKLTVCMNVCQNFNKIFNNICICYIFVFRPFSMGTGKYVNFGQSYNFILTQLTRILIFNHHFSMETSVLQMWGSWTRKLVCLKFDFSHLGVHFVFLLPVIFLKVFNCIAKLKRFTTLRNNLFI